MTTTSETNAAHTVISYRDDELPGHAMYARWTPGQGWKLEYRGQTIAWLLSTTVVHEGTRAKLLDLAATAFAAMCVAGCRVTEVRELAKLHALAEQLHDLWELDAPDTGDEDLLEVFKNTDRALAIASMESDVHALIRELEA